MPRIGHQREALVEHRSDSTEPFMQMKFEQLSFSLLLPLRQNHLFVLSSSAEVLFRLLCPLWPSAAEHERSDTDGRPIDRDGGDKARLRHYWARYYYSVMSFR